jgi:hypothetical protein
MSAEKGNPERGRGQDKDRGVCDSNGQRQRALPRISI